jgi:hypothetical protein
MLVKGQKSPDDGSAVVEGDPEAVLDVPEQFASLSAGLESNGIGNV